MAEKTGNSEIANEETAEEKETLSEAVPVKKFGFTKETASAFGRMRSGVPHKRKTTQEIFSIIDKELLATEAGKAVPKEARKHLTHYLTVRKLVSIAYRNNTDKRMVKVKCPKCSEEGRHWVEMDNLAAEDHSIKALSVLYDRMAPKLGAIHVDVKSENQVDAATQVMADVIMKYVPEDKRKECLDEIQTNLQQARGDFQ
jgi:hypothetical protein